MRNIVSADIRELAITARIGVVAGVHTYQVQLMLWIHIETFDRLSRWRQSVLSCCLHVSKTHQIQIIGRAALDQ